MLFSWVHVGVLGIYSHSCMLNHVKQPFSHYNCCISAKEKQFKKNNSKKTPALYCSPLGEKPKIHDFTQNLLFSSGPGTSNYFSAVVRCGFVFVRMILLSSILPLVHSQWTLNHLVILSGLTTDKSSQHFLLKVKLSVTLSVTLRVCGVFLYMCRLLSWPFSILSSQREESQR